MLHFAHLLIHLNPIRGYPIRGYLVHLFPIRGYMPRLFG